MGEAKKHKIILYNPLPVSFTMPLGIMSIGSALDREKYDVLIIDARVEKDPHTSVLENLEGAICFGASILTGSGIRDALEITRKVKNLKPQILTVWGGWHCSLFPVEPLSEEQSIDVSVQGQGEITFREIMESLDSKSEFSEIGGITWRNPEGEIVRNKPKPIVDLDNLPPVDYSLIDVEKYFARKGKRQLDYISSVGCFYRCAFCADPFVFKRKFSAVSPSRMADEIGQLYKKYKFDDLNFQDETFFTYRERALDFARELIERNIKVHWAATMRADQGDRLSDEEFAVLAKSGLRRVLVGVESGTQEMMDWLKKDIKIEQVLATAQKCLKHKIGSQFPVIVGFPGETEEAFRASLAFAIRLGQMSDHFDIPIFYFKPYPGSDITNNAVAEGYKLPETLDEWANFDYMHSVSPWMSNDRFRLAENVKFYLRLSQTQRKLLKPFKWLARQRLKSGHYIFPFEKLLKNSARKLIGK